MIMTTITFLSRFLQSMEITEGGSNMTSNFTILNNSFQDESNGLSNILRNGTLHVRNDEPTYSPFSLIMYGVVLVLFVCVPLCIEMYSCLLGQRFHLFTRERENFRSGSMEQSSIQRREQGKNSRLWIRLEQNSKVCMTCRLE
jgi:hypothetical protein